MDYIALASIISSAVVSVASLYSSYKSQREIERIKAESKMAELRQSHWNALDDERRKRQAALLERIVAEATAIDEGQNDHSRELLKDLICFRATMKGNPQAINNRIEEIGWEGTKEHYERTMMIVSALSSELNDFQNDPDFQQPAQLTPPQKKNSWIVRAATAIHQSLQGNRNSKSKEKSAGHTKQ